MTATNLHPNSAGSAAAATNALRDIKPPVEITSAWGWVWWVVVALVLVAALTGVVLYLLKRREEAQIVPVVPPHIRAKQKLREALALIGQPREFCILVSDTIRWYLEERFEFHAPERTTEEFLYELQRTDLLTRDQKDSLGEFLQQCDLVKFAKYEPGPPELQALHDSAMRLVEETEPIMATLEAARGQGAVAGPGAGSPVVVPASPAAVARGKRFVLAGIVLQVAPWSLLLFYLAAILSFITHAFGVHDPVQDSAAAGTFMGQMLGVIILTVFCLLAMLAGLVLFMIALTKLRYRAQWFFWLLMIYSVFLLGAFPLGTAAAVFFFVYCLTRRQEFLKPRAAVAVA